MVNLRVVPGVCDVVSLPPDVVAALSDVVPLTRVLRDGDVLGLTVVKLWKTLVSVTVLWRVEKLSRIVGKTGKRLWKNCGQAVGNCWEN